MPVCPKCQSQFEITPEDRQLYDKVSPVINNIKYHVPEPFLCPDCRQQLKMIWRNERNLFHRADAITGESIISIYAEENIATIKPKNFWSDDFDATKWGQDFDPNQPFFEQWHEMMKSIPRMAVTQKNVENSEYTHRSTDLKNCYWSILTFFSEDCHYCHYVVSSKNCIDCAFSGGLELCYDCLDCENCYNGISLRQCENTNNSAHCFECKGIENCLFCTNLRHKKNFLFNQESTPKKIAEIKTEISLSSTKKIEWLKKYQALLLESPRRHASFINCENCTGDYLKDCKDVYKGYDIDATQDCRYCTDGDMSVKDSIDCYQIAINAELCFNCHGAVGTNIFCSDSCWYSSNILYSSECFNSNFLFGCAGLHNKEYCILNKQYTKKEYFDLVPKIIEHMQKTQEWAKFFPPKYSPFGYNHTTGQIYMPLTETEARKQGFNWSNYEAPKPQVEKIIPASKLPEKIKEIPDEILKWAIECEISKKPFRLIPAELKFYREQNIPCPKRHPDVRFLDRFKLRNPRKLWHRKCVKDGCKNEFETSYSPDRPEIVYCEKCYLETVY
ncbi:MAG: hypothetical protein NTZ80_02220 [Patescibacteria group bacterium]|nr:hypothetical protein [Patescibacteria group bacterium]